MTASATIEEAAARCRARMAGAKVGDWVWCCHHDRMLETLTEPPENRIDCILYVKPEHERIVRLDAFRLVVGPLPEWPVKAWRAYNETWQAYRHARQAYDEAWRAYAGVVLAYDAAERAARPEVEALFAVECADVPWGPRGLIFPEVRA